MNTTSSRISDNSDATLNEPCLTRDFISFDGGFHTQGMQQQPDRYRYWDKCASQVPRISRGAGLSYAAASFGGNGISVSHAAFDRVTDFDSENRIVEVEAGITLYGLHVFLVSHGLYLPIQPGHGRITVGGCIAADVHGKNHVRDGTFINQVVSLTLVHPAHGILELSREHEPELFRLTCGGYGLTGHILRVRLCATPIPSQVIELKAVSFANAMEGLTLLERTAVDIDFTYTWHDMARPGAGFGKGLLFQANFSENSPENSSKAVYPPPLLTADMRASWPVPLLNSVTAQILNFLFRFQQRRALSGMKLSLSQALFPVHKSQVYFKFFGKGGFHEYQVLLPLNAMHGYIEAIHAFARKFSIVITLVSAKAFAGSQDLLRFSGKGICLAINIPGGGRANDFMSSLDEQTVILGGIPNIIKDSRLPRAVVDACYPEADHFRSLLRTFDSKRLFRSEISERLGL
jgi:decaprenylphospho-beta-D-ribofuranose 2-oxidase